MLLSFPNFLHRARKQTMAKSRGDKYRAENGSDYSSCDTNHISKEIKVDKMKVLFKYVHIMNES